MRTGLGTQDISDGTAYMLVLGIDYCPHCVAHAHQVRDLRSMVVHV